MKRKEKSYKPDKKDNIMEELEDDERWPSPMEPLEYDSDRDSPYKSSHIVPPPPGMDEQTDEEKKYILEKIQQANRELQDQEAPDLTRRRRLQFKETLVTLVVPPVRYEKDGTTNSREVEGENGPKEAEADIEVSGKLSELKLSPREETVGGSGGFGRAGGRSEGGQGLTEGRVLVEKDGKFDLVSLKELESHGLLPPLANSSGSLELNNLTKILSSSCSPRSRSGSSPLRAPRPPAQPRNRPSSANHSQRDIQRRGAKRRVQSASGTPCQATYRLSPQQKELLQKIQERKEKLAREVGRK